MIPGSFDTRSSVRTKVLAIVRLTRLRTSMSAIPLTVIGGFAAGDTIAHVIGPLLTAALASTAMIAFAQVVNDISALPLDRRHKPYRPLPSGDLTVGEARSVAIVLVVTALAAAFAAGAGAAVLVSACLLLGWLYSAHLKDSVLIGNLVVAVVSSCAFAVGAVALGAYGRSVLIGQSLVLLFILGGELFKTTLDEPGDASLQLRTIATSHGIRLVAVVATLTYLGMAALFVIPWCAGITSLYFMAAGIVFVLMPTGVGVAHLWLAEDCQSRRVRTGYRCWRLAWTPGIALLLLLA